MCTVSVVPVAGRLRVMVNRDERHTRPEAHPPTAVRTAGGLALLPIDPQGGGTWVAATSAGLAFALLNVSAPAAAGPSRGGIIPELLAATSLGDAVDRAGRLCGRGWPPHRLIVMDLRQAFELRLRKQGVSIQAVGLDRPRLFTSSSLGDDLVEPVRAQLFGELVLMAEDRLRGQDTFHHHRWADRPHLSVHMRRHDAATRSVTTVDLDGSQVSMRYESVCDAIGEAGWLMLPREAAARPLARVS